MKRVAIIHPWFPQYRLQFFTVLKRSAASRGVHVEIFHGQTPPEWSDRNDSVADASIATELPTAFRRLPFGTLITHSLEPVRERGPYDLIIVEHAIRNLETYHLMRENRRRVAFWGHGGAFTGRKSRQPLRNALIRKAPWFFAYTPGGRNAVVSAGLDPSRVTVVMNSIDADGLREDLAGVSDEEATRFAEELDLRGKTALYIGGLDSEKRLPFLLEAAERVAGSEPSFRLLIAGGGAESAAIEEFAGSRDWVHYLGRADGRRKALILRVADVIVNPGRVGLVAVDSLVAGVPVLTTRWSRHAPEVEYLSDGVTALFSEDRLDSFAAMLQGAFEPERLQRLRSSCQLQSASFSAATMADNFLDGIEAALSVVTGPALQPRR